MTEYAPDKSGRYLSDVLQFSKDFDRCEKYTTDNKHNSFHLAPKYARIFVLGHNLFLEARSFLSEKIVRFSEQKMSTDKYSSIFSRQKEAIIYLYKGVTLINCTANLRLGS